MGRKRLGELPTVLATVRVPGEHAGKLTAGGKKLGEAIRELIEGACREVPQLQLSGPREMQILSEVPRGDRRERVRTPGRFKTAVDVAHEAVRKRDVTIDDVPRVAKSLVDGEVVEKVRHLATSHRLTCLCPTCTDYRAKNDLPLGGLPAKKKGFKR